MGQYQTPQSGPGRQARQDFSKLIRELTVAAKMGGGEPADNPRLRAAMDKAGANMTGHHRPCHQAWRRW